MNQIAEVIKYSDGSVVCYGKSGQILPLYSGAYHKVRHLIMRHAPAHAEFWKLNVDTFGAHQVSRSDFSA